MKGHPPHRFGFVRDWVLQASDAGALTPVLFWLSLDYRLSQLVCDCFSCEPDAGVPLARVWLHVVTSGSKRQCHVLAISAHPPYRRPLGHDCWPAEPGCLHVGEVIWQAPDAARVILAKRGIGIAERIDIKLDGLKDPLGLEAELRKSQWPTVCGDQVVLQVLDTPYFGSRVIGVWPKK